MTETAYQQALGNGWDHIPDITRQLHSPDPVVVFEGLADISRTANILANLAADIMGLPKAGNGVPARITVTRQDDGETLERNYGGRVFATRQRVLPLNGETLLVETVGPFILYFRLTGHKDGIDFALVKAQLWGLTLPPWLAPRMRAAERADGDVHVFDVGSALPLLGELVSYTGRLRQIA